jgi:hypothetical protein
MMTMVTKQKVAVVYEISLEKEILFFLSFFFVMSFDGGGRLRSYFFL